MVRRGSKQFTGFADRMDELMEHYFLGDEDRKTKIQACVARAITGETLVLDLSVVIVIGTINGLI